MKIAIVGNGIVGNATGEALKTKDHQVMYYDVMASKSDFMSLDMLMEWAEVIVICTPTDNEPSGKCSLSTVEPVMRIFESKTWEGKKTIVQRSTCPPGTAQSYVERFQRAAHKIGESFEYVVWPSFLYRALSAENELNPPKQLVGARNKEVSDWWLQEVLKNPECPVFTGSYEFAEVAKYASNNAQVMVIAFWNELYDTTREFGVDTDWVMASVCSEKSLESLKRVHGKGFNHGRMNQDCEAWVHWAGGNAPFHKAGLEVNKKMLEKHGVQNKPTHQLKKELEEKLKGGQK